MIILNIIVILGLVIFNIKDTRKIESLERMSRSKDKYIQLLESRAREERIRKNNQFNNK